MDQIDSARFSNEPSGEDILSGAFRHQPSPPREVEYSEGGFASGRFSPVPAVGIHPRVLCSPEDLPAVRRRLAETEVGRQLHAGLRQLLDTGIRKPGAWPNRILTAFASDKWELAVSELEHPEKETSHQKAFLHPLMLLAFDCWLRGDGEEASRTAAAAAGYAAFLEPLADAILAAPCGDYAARSGSWHALGSYELLGYDYLGIAYDFLYNAMTDEQRCTVRRLISKITKGRIVHGMELPAHWRNWNWVTHGLYFAVLGLAIEGEDGYDPRVYTNSVELLKDFLSYGISANGTGHEAVGYFSAGMNWASDAMVAMARRGDNLFAHGHYRELKRWLLHSMQPFGGEWVSHGDLGTFPPGYKMMQAMKAAYPNDGTIDFVMQNVLYRRGQNDKPVWKERMPEPSVIAMLCAEDCLRGADGALHDYKAGSTFEESLTFFDPETSSLITRSGWSSEAIAMQFECRTDTAFPSHEHADRGVFTLSALGIAWATESSRSPETKYHSSILIDGKGQGFFAPPGRWLGLYDDATATFGVCDAKNAYDYFWPKTMVAATSPDDPRLGLQRWSHFKKEVDWFREHYKDVPQERDPSPHVAAYYEGYQVNDPRMWDEDGWPIRVPHNPVRRAYRTAGLVRGEHSYSLIVDDIQKDDQERLYEWLMMTSMSIEVKSISGSDVLLGLRGGRMKPEPGDPLLLVRVLEAADPALPREYGTKPSIRLEAFEKKNTFADSHPIFNKGGGATYGLDQRLVVGSRSTAPNFKILLFPHRHGEVLPGTQWDETHSRLTIGWEGQKDEFIFGPGNDGRTRFTFNRNGQQQLRVD